MSRSLQVLSSVNVQNKQHTQENTEVFSLANQYRKWMKFSDFKINDGKPHH